MWRTSTRCYALLCVVCLPACAQQVLQQRNAPDATGSKIEETARPGGVEILSDTSGVDVNSYIKKMMADIYRNWVPLIPKEAKPPESKQGEALIRFKILPDGKIGNMWLDGSSHDDAINRSCWGAITSEGQFPPLPAGLETRPLELRIHFFVNKQPESATVPSEPR